MIPLVLLSYTVHSQWRKQCTHKIEMPIVWTVCALSKPRETRLTHTYTLYTRSTQHKARLALPATTHTTINVLAASRRLSQSAMQTDNLSLRLV